MAAVTAVFNKAITALLTVATIAAVMAGDMASGGQSTIVTSSDVAVAPGGAFSSFAASTAVVAANTVAVAGEVSRSGDRWSSSSSESN
jgi:hypothetical protein